MQCRYCHAWNEEDERRCVVCSRRLSGPEPVVTSPIPALEPLPRSEAPAPSAPSSFQQPLLFRDPNASKVIPIPTLTPMRPRASEATPKRSARAPRSNARRASDSQQSLDFRSIQKTTGTQVEAVIYCDAPVALPAHRAIAAAVDAAVILAALGVFLAIFLISGGTIDLTRQNIPFFLAIAIVMSLFYRFLWCIADGDTPGMRIAGLKLVDFDGRRPDREQRGLRQVAGVLSVLSAGLGLVWALVDEESLTWHDHISKTFPTVG